MSTLAQTTFNSVNILMGVGILSLPFAFQITGWVVGLTILMTCAGLTHHTANLLRHCLDYMPPAPSLASSLRPLLQSKTSTPYRRAMTFGDIGEIAFGSRGRNMISVIFCLELSAAGVALVILASDSCTAIFPSWNGTIVKCVAVLIALPLTLPNSLKWASYASLVGIVALINLLAIILYDGLTTTETPGSLIVPAQTYLWPRSWEAVPLSFGLIMAGFAGHSVFANIYRDMIEPTHYPKMLKRTYIIVTIVYLFIAGAGYAMFGDFTMPEITQNLPLVPSYNRSITHMTLWLTTINPLTKFPLNLNPINVQIENILLAALPPNTLGLPTTRPLPLLPRTLLRSLTAATILTIAICFPTFHSIMGLLGSFCAFSVCVVFPSSCYLKLYGARLPMRVWLVEVAVLAVGAVMGVLGTIWAFASLNE
ncbi:transmembrane amino acid transporter protein-domain-containing protein [Fimicolochytrium jonesii]|uniref:transmembrane amino acid transporter protein-domain-containing protein n=1 Tax=Fimicolochytrium jonesii TaxID=1396493 RepID=UPI0022FF28A4|nr:transmembrane amino acid transporter protein-domain-containing protein [Fimicolochytrium jonesii]KAI8815895.1 transmembrane amino acid transporter protein-domain-containing protein [Fimicolochytrium jonesii]